MTAFRRSRPCALGLVVLAVQGACAVTGTYEPRPTHRISILDSGEHNFARDGRRFALGIAGSGEDMVSGNELAVAYARRAHRQQIAGLTLYATGLAGLGTGIVLLVPPGRSEGHVVAGNILVLTSFVPMLVSLGLVFAARANLHDAVNIYNDALEGPLDPGAFDDHPPPGGR